MVRGLAPENVKEKTNKQTKLNQNFYFFALHSLTGK